MAKRLSGHEMLTAVRAGNADALRAMLAPGGAMVAKVARSVGLEGMTAALERGRDDLAVMLIDAGSSLHDKQYTSASALAKVAQFGSEATLRHLLVVEPADKWSDEERLDAIGNAADRNRADLLAALPAVPIEQLGKVAARAAYLGHDHTLRWCLNQGVPASHTSEAGGETASLLHHAAEGMAATTSTLIDAGARVDARDSRGRTPLMHAAREEIRRSVSRPSEAAKLDLARERGKVIRESARPDAPPPGRPDTALALLLSAGADATLKDDDGLDALAILAAEFPGLMPGPNESAIGLDAVTAAVTIPADAARTMWDDDVTDAERDAAGEIVFRAELAARRTLVAAYVAALRAAGARGQSDADRAVARAVENGDAAALTAALKAGGSPRVVVVINNGHSTTTALGRAASLRHAEVCRRLLDAGAHPDDGGRDGPPLVNAARSGRQDLVKLLLDRGADPRRPKPGEVRYTPLDAARIAGHKEVAALLKSVAGEPPATEPFAPGVTFYSTGTELLVRADALAVARAAAASIGGDVVENALHRTIAAGTERAALIVRLDGSDWTSVMPHVGFDRLPDERWHALARDASAATQSRAVLLCYEKVSHQYEYWMLDAGEVVEHYEQDPGEPPFPPGRFRSDRGRAAPENLEDGGAVLDRLATDERFNPVVGRPGATPGKPFEVVFAGDRRKMAEVHYVRA